MTAFTHGYALLIGVGSAKDPSLSMPATARDAQAIRDILTDERFCAYPNNDEHIRLLHDADATGSGILKGLGWLKTQAQHDPDATVVVYYSGHGWLEPFDCAHSLLLGIISPSPCVSKKPTVSAWSLVQP